MAGQTDMLEDIPTSPDGERHPSALEPAIVVVNLVMSVIGAIIGLQIITTLGITPNTSIIGVLVAIVISRVPLSFFNRFR